MLRALLAVGLAFGFVISALAQSTNPAPSNPQTQPNRLEFEVATIKAVDPESRMQINGIDVYPGGRVIIQGNNLKGLITIAFHLSYWQIQGGEDWTTKDTYNVEAKAPESVGMENLNLRHSVFQISDERLREMLQTLLIERFQLQFHRETKMGTVYLLERSGKPLKLQPSNHVSSAADSSSDFFGGVGWAGRWVLFNTTMEQLAESAANHFVQHPVLDETGLSGAFSYASPNEEDVQSITGDPLGSFESLIDEIGLKLTPTKGQVEYLVVDRAAKPSPN
jgi:uncharacterized protein (TIGR03435 family)